MRIALAEPGPQPLRAVPAPAVAKPDMGAGASLWCFAARSVDDRALWAAADKSNCSYIVVEHDRHSKVRTRKSLVVWIDYGSEFPMQHPQVELEKTRLAARDDGFERITSHNLLWLLDRGKLASAKVTAGSQVLQ